MSASQTPTPDARYTLHAAPGPDNISGIKDRLLYSLTHMWGIGRFIRTILPASHKYSETSRQVHKVFDEVRHSINSESNFVNLKGSRDNLRTQLKKIGDFELEEKAHFDPVGISKIAKSEFGKGNMQRWDLEGDYLDRAINLKISLQKLKGNGDLFDPSLRSSFWLAQAAIRNIKNENESDEKMLSNLLDKTEKELVKRYENLKKNPEHLGDLEKKLVNESSNVHELINRANLLKVYRERFSTFVDLIIDDVHSAKEQKAAKPDEFVSMLHYSVTLFLDEQGRMDDNQKAFFYRLYLENIDSLDKQHIKQPFVKMKWLFHPTESKSEEQLVGLRAKAIESYLYSFSDPITARQVLDSTYFFISNNRDQLNQEDKRTITNLLDRHVLSLIEDS